MDQRIDREQAKHEGKASPDTEEQHTHEDAIFHDTSGQAHHGPGYVNGRKTKIDLLSLKRPHMRAFHASWFAFFICFTMWFAIPPLMVTIKKPPCLSADSPVCQQCAINFPDPLALGKDKICAQCAPYDDRVGAGCGGLGLSASDITTSNVMSVSGTLIIRIFIGPIADSYGVRRTYSVLLILLSIPGFCAAAVTNLSGLLAVRFFISLVGGSFVLTQLWTSLMFHTNVVGLANATSAGWGNLGGGASLAIMGTVFASFKSQGYTNNQAWKYTLAWPPSLLFITGIVILFFTDDSPEGNFCDMRKDKEEKAKDGKSDGVKNLTTEEAILASGGEPTNIAQKSLVLAAKNWNCWILFACYAFSFGVELVVNSNMPLYLSQAFTLTQAQGGMAASLFGLCNLFARPLGGFVSDEMFKLFGVRGRLWALFLCTIAMGSSLLAFASCTQSSSGITGALVALFFWATLTNMTEGACFAVVPFVEPSAIGGVAGLVGAGGTAGALGGNFLVRIGGRPAFCMLGWLAMITGMLVPIIWMPGFGSMFLGAEKEEEHGPARIEKFEEMVNVEMAPEVVEYAGISRKSNEEEERRSSNGSFVVNLEGA
ncbi:nitrate transporter [Guillardia theta CCMP2712]|uniref:Nitrate transporter n=2 Tax=Guillardia theta TaxID=55529 RepID=L1IPT0_GUITC|nr:nitrate transporter [Guillardia theta CCMP2712]EKX37815.1 nitrate transporter [Guillardia theta CCMP2712]|mmetsp:Transcript_17715/g.58310  ORF Transcript_17715/g.58310 Transcript_17715/m.58310 type:complete len:598 (+) Transcript_17715:278-2071(+)|eukprot:XP_005824795.1 nitrate transporter [Guillardia theta CCMP2712]